MITEIGAVLVALIITTGVVLLAVQGKPTDGLEAGFLAVLGFYFGGSLAKSAATRAVGKAKEAIESVQTGQVNATAANTAAVVAGTAENGPSHGQQ